MSNSKPKLKPAAVVAYTDKARDLVFQAQAIAAVAAAASAESSRPADQIYIEKAMNVVEKLLEDVATMLDPGTVEELIAGQVPLSSIPRDRVV